MAFTGSTSVARDDDNPASQKQIGGAQDAVDRALAGSVAVVEEVLRLGVVDGDDGIGEGTSGMHGAQADDAGGGFLRAPNDGGEQLSALGMERIHQVAAVVERDVGLQVKRGVDVLVVGLGVRPVDSIGFETVVRDQVCGHVVLRAQRVAGAEPQLSPASSQRDGKVGRLAGDMQAGRQTQALQRLLLLEALANERQHWHFGGGPFRPRAALGGE
jgi:hypothetical protein